MREILAKILQLFLDGFEDFFFEKDFSTRRIEKEGAEFWQRLLEVKNYENILSFFDYGNGFIKTAIQEIKYHRNSKILENIVGVCADYLGGILEEKINFIPIDDVVLIPLPSHKNRSQEKGFEHTKDIAEMFCKIIPINSKVETNILNKIKETPPQTSLGRKLRLINIKNSFEIDQKLLRKNAFYIVIDDVTTTGATLKEAKKVFEKGGIKNVICVAIARG